MKPWILLASMLLIVLAALIITIALTAGWNEKESLDEAEWLISEFCNSNMTCHECYKFSRPDNTCKYKMCIPGKWSYINEDEFRNPPNLEEKRKNGNI